jgi:hypothetical protein
MADAWGERVPRSVRQLFTDPYYSGVTFAIILAGVPVFCVRGALARRARRAA